MTIDVGSNDMDITEEAIGGADMAIPGGVNPFGKSIDPIDKAELITKMLTSPE